MLIDNKLELITKYNIKNYTIRYLSKPEPIVLEGLSECGIAPYNTYGDAGNDCKLPSSAHRNILLKVSTFFLLLLNSTKEIYFSAGFK